MEKNGKKIIQNLPLIIVQPKFFPFKKSEMRHKTRTKSNQFDIISSKQRITTASVKNIDPFNEKHNMHWEMLKMAKQLLMAMP